MGTLYHRARIRQDLSLMAKHTFSYSQSLGLRYNPFFMVEPWWLPRLYLNTRAALMGQKRSRWLGERLPALAIYGDEWDQSFPD